MPETSYVAVVPVEVMDRDKLDIVTREVPHTFHFPEKNRPRAVDKDETVIVSCIMRRTPSGPTDKTSGPKSRPMEEKAALAVMV